LEPGIWLSPIGFEQGRREAKITPGPDVSACGLGPRIVSDLNVDFGVECEISGMAGTHCLMIRASVQMPTDLSAPGLLFPSEFWH
jgi:hypothetical protein